MIGIIWIGGSLCSFLLFLFVEYRYCISRDEVFDNRLIFLYLLISCLTGPFAFLFSSSVLLVSFFLSRLDE